MVWKIPKETDDGKLENRRGINFSPGHWRVRSFARNFSEPPKGRSTADNDSAAC
jgi:hypothetical protein